MYVVLFIEGHFSVQCIEQASLPILTLVFLLTVSFFLLCQTHRHDFGACVKSKDHKWGGRECLSFSDWLYFLIVIISSCIHFPANDIALFMMPENIPLCAYIQHFLYPFPGCLRLGWSHNFPIVHSAIVNSGVQLISIIC